MEFEKYHKLKRMGDEENKNIFDIETDEIIIEEKIDGGNFRFYVSNEGNIIFGSRTQQLTSNEGEDTNVNKNFRRCVQFVRDTIKDKDLSDYKGLIFYGECCVKHTIGYAWDKMPPYLGFDIKKENTYLGYDLRKKIFDDLGLPMVPLIKRVKAGDIKSITDDDVPISEYALDSAKDRQAEGIVFKNYERQIFGKYVRNAFKEKNSEVFGGSPKYNKIGDTDNAEFIFKYVTNPRIEKIILKILDEGRPLDMTIMGDLIRQVYLDIIEEEWREILTSNWVLDLKNVRKSIAPRVRAVLNQIITNNALNKGDEL